MFIRRESNVKGRRLSSRMVRENSDLTLVVRIRSTRGVKIRRESLGTNCIALVRLW